MIVHRIAFAACAASLFAFPGVARASVDDASARVLAQSAKAVGASALSHVRFMRIDAKTSAVGLTGTGTQWLDFQTGRLAEFTTLPPYEQDDGYDGRVAWNRDRSGVVWDDGSDAGRSTELSNAYLNAYQLWRPGAAGATVRYGGEKQEKGATYDVLQVVAPGSKLPVDVWFDRNTHLPVREVQVVGAVTSTTTLASYRRAHGLMIPHAIHIESSQGNNSDTTVTSVAFDPAGAAAHLVRPQSMVHDFLMRGNGVETTVPIDVVENHVYLNVMLDGKGPYRFIFDTGGQNVVDPAVAKEIGATGKGAAQGAGVGAQTESLSFGIVDELAVGDAVLKDQLFAIAPVRMGFGISAGRPADGLIGWQVLARFITSFNYGDKTVVLRVRPQQPPANAHVIPFVFNGTQPQIACGIDDIPSQCTIDTGARDTMSFYAPYLKEHPQVQPPALTANGITGFGFGGPSFGRLGRVSSVRLDGLTLSDQVADFTSQNAGAFAQPFVAANLGGNMLRRFDVTFDYGKQTMALIPNGAFGERDSYDRGGMFLVRKDGNVIVADARPGTPAAESGLQRGDVLTAIDGAPTGGMSLEEVRAYFLRPAGTVVHVTVTGKAGAERTVNLTLRDYV